MTLNDIVKQKIAYFWLKLICTLRFDRYGAQKSSVVTSSIGLWFMHGTNTYFNDNALSHLELKIDLLLNKIEAL